MSTDKQQASVPQRPLWRRALRTSYLILCSVLLLAVVLEAGWRIAGDLSAPKALQTQAFAPPDRVGYTLHPFMQMANPPNKRTDPGPHMSGWRVDPRHAVLEEGRLRILFLGGSTTGTDYPSFVRQQLEPELGAVTVYNLGFDRHSSLHSLYKFWTYVDEIQPDLVVVLHNVNDFYRGFTPPRYALPEYRADYSHYAGAMNLFWSRGKSRFDQRPVFYARPALRLTGRLDPPDRSFTGMLRSLAAGSEVLRALAEATGLPAPSPFVESPDAEPPLGEPQDVMMFADDVLRSLPAFERNLRNLRAGCALKQVPLLLLTMPFSVETTERSYLLPGRLMSNDGVRHMQPPDFGFGMQRFNETVVGLRDEPRAWVLDLAPELAESRLFQDEVHLIQEGVKRQGRLVAAYILEQGLLAGR